jgi:hypothetical protein
MVALCLHTYYGSTTKSSPTVAFDELFWSGLGLAWSLVNPCSVFKGLRLNRRAQSHHRTSCYLVYLYHRNIRSSECDSARTMSQGTTYIRALQKCRSPTSILPLIRLSTFEEIHLPSLTIMENIRIPFKQDDFGNDIFARVSWQQQGSQPSEPKPIGKPKTPLRP